MADGAVVLPMVDAVSPNSATRPQLRLDDTTNAIDKDKPELTVAAEEARELLNLPIELLKEIIKEVTHTNDLTSLALTCRALHSLVIPQIYSRFDIVWPEVSSPADSKAGVDALTHGLSTLSMHHLIFERDSDGLYQPSERRVGNNYANYTRKFSLGNGPADWVQDYMITKETGKLLSTLVAVSVARMFNLESFLWDMPTGVSRDVFLALGSLAERQAADGCALERFLIRWHDNSADATTSGLSSHQDNQFSTSMPEDSGLAPVGVPFPSDHPEHPLHPLFDATAYCPAPRSVEYPTLSALPALKSLSVLDVDELSYLDELSILIEKSKDVLEELRVGISKKAANAPFVMAWDGIGLQQVDHQKTRPDTPSKIGRRRLGGVLGIILGRIFDIRRPVLMKNECLTKDTRITNQSQETGPKRVTDLDVSTLLQDLTLESRAPPLAEMGDPLIIQHIIHSNGADVSELEGNVLVDEFTPKTTESLAEVSDSLPSVEPPVGNISTTEMSQITTSQTVVLIPKSNKITSKASDDSTAPADNCHSGNSRKGKLRVKTLELERVPLSIYVLQRGIDWSVLTSLTILDCAYNEKLWKMLNRQFKNSETAAAHRPAAGRAMQYHLNLTHLHTDCATPPLMTFLRETLAPNTLEVLFLQDRRKRSTSCVGIKAIVNGPLRRHKKSLRKVLIDSSDRLPTSPATVTDTDRWRTWMLTSEALKFITSGKMTRLRELSVAISYRDWHTFLQRLPNIADIRSLNIPFIGDHVTTKYDAKELALQILDMIYVKPEIELCYLGISNKCFEIVEGKFQSDATTQSQEGLGHEEEPSDDDDDDEDVSDDDEDDGEQSDEDEATATEAVEAQDADHEYSEASDWSGADSDAGSEADSDKTTLRLREILFYDDKVAIFKARHMSL